MFVRLAFAVAINIDPDILIVDEALSVGDVFFHNLNIYDTSGKSADCPNTGLFPFVEADLHAKLIIILKSLTANAGVKFDNICSIPGGRRCRGARIPRRAA